jgi:hypothetical protein
MFKFEDHLDEKTGKIVTEKVPLSDPERVDIEKTWGQGQAPATLTPQDVTKLQLVRALRAH